MVAKYPDIRTGPGLRLGTTGLIEGPITQAGPDVACHDIAPLEEAEAAADFSGQDVVQVEDLCLIGSKGKIEPWERKGGFDY